MDSESRGRQHLGQDPLDSRASRTLLQQPGMCSSQCLHMNYNVITCIYMYLYTYMYLLKYLFSDCF